MLLRFLRQFHLKHIRVNKIDDVNETIYPNIMFDDAIPDTKYYLHLILESYKNKCNLSGVNGIGVLQGINSERETINQIEKTRIRKRGN